MTYRDNDVYFAVGSGYALIRGSYVVESYAVTTGQDPNRHIHSGLTVECGSNGRMTFRVGRHGSTEVADWFNGQVAAWRTTFNHAADRLNFAFLGTLKLTMKGGLLGESAETFTFCDVALAQGRSGTSNNWWFGGRRCTHIADSRQVVCEGSNSKGDAITFRFLRGGNDVSTVGATPWGLIDTASWMSRIGDSDRMDDIMLPGSHDAGMSELHHCAPSSVVARGATQTQGGAVARQLADGSRYLDIRVDYDHGRLVTYHRTGGFGCNGQNLEAVLDEARTFVRMHSTETAILKFSHIRSHDGHDPNETKSKLNDLLNAYDADLYKSAVADVNLAAVAVGGLRGRLVAVFDYDEYIDPAGGRFRYRDGSSPQTAANLTVFDEYSNTSLYEKMKRDQLEKWNRHGGMGRGYLFLLSWTLTSEPPLFRPVRGLAGEANGRLPGVLISQIVDELASKPNIVYVDFVSSPVAQSIVGFNF